ncbi:molybdenum ABC transporter ATP-binding protein [Pontiella agarivorans]|uniref:Molybdenum ABC transporter ATP-binding protein n=1 Tax=Pontiella agarivorans TaxID=3038953 RepID=A0ABU5MYV9_9BACT|nr:molybdenum ABC transporter ATP-binding protein [Pontiella agarivorans]MDZ8119357.1 molybdenum ABC transporter ATP-binding protein [Pontiella agarivorans]
MNLDVDIYYRQGNFLLDTEFKCFESAMGVFGHSGCGKSTLFRAIAGLIRPDGGHIILGGETFFDAARRIFVPPHRRGIGLVFQDARLFPHWSVEQNLRAGECLKERIKNRPFNFDDIVDLLNIQHLIDREVTDLSGGEKQRIAIGRTLLANPKLLLMDEPVSGLDVSLKMQILPFLARIHTTLQIPTILISHDLGEILQLTDQLLLMRDGSVTGKNSLEKLAGTSKTLRELKGAQLTNLLKMQVAQHDKDHGVTRLDLPNHPELRVEMELAEKLPIGRAVNIGIAANQIAIAPHRIETISMRNQLPGRVRSITHTPDRSLCKLDTAAGPLFAEITRGTEKEMNLTPASSVWILFKSRAIQPMGMLQ